MSQLLTYAEVDTGIQEKMAGSAPDSTKRLNAINNTVQDLYAKFDIESSIREYIFYAIANGEAVNLTTDVPDFKKVKDLRYLADSKHDNEFAEVEDDLFATHIGSGRLLDEYSVTYNDGKLFARMNTVDGVTSKQIHSMGDLTSNGSWENDADDTLNLTTTTVGTLNQSEVIKFDIDVSQTAEDYAQISNNDITAIDLSDYVNLGKLRFWIYLPSITNFTSIEVRWGSYDTELNYWVNTATTQANGSAFIAGWNRVEIDWNGATESGTVDNSSIVSLGIKLNYASGFTDQVNVKVEEVTMYLPTPFKLKYYTYYTSKTNAGTFQEDLTTTSNDEILLPKRYKDLVVSGAVEKLLPMALGDDGELQVRRAEKNYREERNNLKLDIGNSPKRPSRKIKIHKTW
jgi:hypothetical protein